MRLGVLLLLPVGLAIVAACGSSPTKPTPPTPPVTPPVNALPVIDSIGVQGSRAKEPSNFADVNESVAVTAKVHDDETAADQLQYGWTATAGTFTGTGAAVTWVAPATVPSPGPVTITLKVTEKYGTGNAFEHSVEGSATLSLHDSVAEVGTMSRQFLLDFSDTTIKDADYIMRNFKAAACPEPSRVSDERDDVIKNYTYYRMISFRVDQPAVTVNFGSTCSSNHGPRKGDGCAAVGVMWDSIDTRDNSRTPNAGTDFLAAVYAATDARWWLCASDYAGHLASNPAVAFRYPR